MVCGGWSCLDGWSSLSVWRLRTRQGTDWQTGRVNSWSTTRRADRQAWWMVSCGRWCTHSTKEGRAYKPVLYRCLLGTVNGFRVTRRRRGVKHQPVGVRVLWGVRQKSLAEEGASQDERESHSAGQPSSSFAQSVSYQQFYGVVACWPYRVHEQSFPTYHVARMRWGRRHGHGRGCMGARVEGGAGSGGAGQWRRGGQGCRECHAALRVGRLNLD